MATIKYWNGTAWELAIVGKQGPVGPTGPTGPAGTATLTTYLYYPSAGATSISGVDYNGNTLSYTPGKEQVFLNGVLLVGGGADYTATTGTSITGLAALASGDVVEILVIGTFNVANAVLDTTLTTKGDLYAATAAGSVTRLGVGANNTVLTADSTTATGLKWAATTVPAFVGCFLKKSAVQSINTATPTLISFDQEDFDSDGFHDNSTNNSRITIPSGKDGYYLFTWQATWSQVDSGTGSDNTFQFYLTKNGSTQVMTNNFRNDGTAVDLVVQNGTTLLNLVATDYITISCRQDSGSSRNVLSSNYQTFFSCVKVG